MQIFPNGILSYSLAAEQQPDLDSNGLPIPAATDEPVSVICTVTTLSEDRKGRYDDGRYRNCTYSVTLNLEDVGNQFRTVNTVTLDHDIKGPLGTFQVQRIEFYSLTQTVELWV